ncbi:MAG TPA: hypothetical protein DCR93_32335 [Cytophagales bacterium]|nr:hypothetical protein [Cytophagales bacterium]HAP63982.1 hypothetical protein [Cytophagales bacterium]
MSILGACISRYQEIIPNRIRVIWDPSLAVPLVKTSITLEDFLEQLDTTDLLGQDDEGIISFFFEESLASERAGELYSIPDQTFDERVALPSVFITPFVIDTTIVFDTAFAVDLTTDQGERLDSILLNGGNLVTVLDVTFTANEGYVRIDVPAVILESGEELVQEFRFTGNNDPAPQSSSLEGARLILNDDDGERNKFVFNAHVELTYRNTAVSAASADINFSLTDLDWRAVFGDLSSRDVPTASGSIPFDIFGDINQGQFRLTDPRMTLVLNNSFGLPVQLELDNIIAIGNDGTVLPLEGSVVDDPQILGSPSLNEIGESVTSTISFDRNTSNLADMLAILPNRLDYVVNGIVNPGGDNNNFVLDSSIVEGILQVEVPLSGTISNLTYETDFEFSLDSIDLAVDSAAIIINSQNTLPLDLDVQVYLLDEDFEIIDSLFTDPDLIIAAPVDSNGDVTDEADNSTSVTANRATLDNLSSATYLRLGVRVNTSGGGTTSVNLRPEYGLSVQVGIITNFEIVQELDLTSP